MAERHHGDASGNSQAVCAISTASSSAKPPELAVNWGDRYLELAVRCFAAGRLSESEIAERVLGYLPEPADRLADNPDFWRAGGAVLAASLDRDSRP